LLVEALRAIPSRLWFLARCRLGHLHLDRMPAMNCMPRNRVESLSSPKHQPGRIESRPRDDPAPSAVSGSLWSLSRPEESQRSPSVQSQLSVPKPSEPFEPASENLDRDRQSRAEKETDRTGHDTR
jgi:hypothetical protein